MPSPDRCPLAPHGLVTWLDLFSRWLGFCAGMLASLVLGLIAGAHAGAVELTSDNFDELVTNSGKGAFVKFLAPW